MIKNLIFDCGNVLFTFSKKSLLDKYVGDDPEKELFIHAVFDDWETMDLGVPSISYFEDVKKRLPERLWGAAENIIFRWSDDVKIIDEITDFILEVKKKGVKVYALSNMPDVFVNDHSFIPVLNHFDGLLFSCTVRVMKPDTRFYEHFLKEFNLNPDECLFTDDLKANVDAAEQVGIHAFLFEPANPHKYVEYARKAIER